MKTNKPKQTKADLRRKVAELESQLACSYHFASMELHKASNLMGSGVVITLTALGGKQLIVPVTIRDGLSHETITALRADIVRSWESATELKPKG